VTVLDTDVSSWIERASEEINANLSSIYEVPLRCYKEPDFTTGLTTTKYPPPIGLMCARLVAGHIFDEVVQQQQEPDIADWGKNQRALAYDDLTRIKAGLVVLSGQVFTGRRFVRQSLFDHPRASHKGDITLPNRESGK